MRKRNLRNRNNRNNEKGIALLIVLMALFLVAAVGMGMIYMSNTETSINANYRDTQLAFFSMRGGLEEMRDRMRTSAPNPITLPTAMPGSATLNCGTTSTTCVKSIRLTINLLAPAATGVDMKTRVRPVMTLVGTARLVNN